MNITAVSQQKAVDFLKSKARPLEAALFAHEFEGAPPDAAFEALGAFQNEDGGFGHGLEPDVQTAVSSVLTTTVALQTLRHLGAGSNYKEVQGAMRYLVDQYDSEQKGWPMLPPEAEGSPHAPWWNGVGLGSKKVDNFLINPRVEIIGYLWEHQPIVPDFLLEELTHAALDHLEARQEPLDMHDLLCLQRLAQTDALPEIMKTAVILRYTNDAQRQIETNPANWQGYNLQPLDLIHSPSALLYNELSDAVEANLDFLIENQQEDGAWHPPWNWGEQFSDAWPQAEQAWSGFLTLHKLRVLRNFGRLA